MLNRDVRLLEEKLIADINESPILMEAKRCVLLSVLRLVEKEADKAIINENYEEAMQNTPIEEKGERNAEGTR